MSKHRLGERIWRTLAEDLTATEPTTKPAYAYMHRELPSQYLITSKILTTPSAHSRQSVSVHRFGGPEVFDQGFAVRKEAGRIADAENTPIIQEPANVAGSTEVDGTQAGSAAVNECGDGLRDLPGMRIVSSLVWLSWYVTLPWSMAKKSEACRPKRHKL